MTNENSNAALGDAPLAALPFTPRLVSIGDSIIKHAHDYAGGAPIQFGNTARGEATWARFLDPRFYHHAIYDAASVTNPAVNNRGFIGMNAGIAGDMSNGGLYGGVLSRIEDVKAMLPDIVYLSIGVNDITQNVDAATIKGNIEKTLKALKAAASPPKVILGTVRPRLNLATKQAAVWKDVNAGIVALASTYGAVLLDTANILGKDGNPYPGVNYDGTHNTNYGAYLVGQKLAEIVRTLYPTATNPYRDATGNVLPNPGFAGTNGVIGSGCTGHAPTNWTFVRSSGNPVPAGGSRTVAQCEPATDPNLGVTCQLTFKSPRSAPGRDYFKFGPSAPVVLGKKDEWVQACMYIRVAGLAGSMHLRLQNTTATSSKMLAVGLYNTIAAPMPVGPWEGWIMTEPTQLDADGSLDMSLQIRCERDSTGDFTIQVGKPWLRKIPDPRPGYNTVNPLWGAPKP